MMTPSPRPAKKPRPQAVLTVRSVTPLTPRLTRVVVGGDQIERLNPNQHADRYVKLLLPQPGSGLTPPYDMDAIREQTPELLPSRRTYTVRRWDHDAQELWLDVVIHAEPGRTGIASEWARTATPGDQIAMNGAGGGYTPRTDARQHLLIGDHAAVPAIGSALDAMPADAVGQVLIHLEHAEDQLDLDAPDGMRIQWIIGDREELVQAVESLELPQELIAERGLQVFCHLERGATKRLRRSLINERGLDREDVSISAYWALGRVEDQFQAEKREAVGQIF
ncbi:siderophore-interacting protein [Helcobacillus sp. ACRRO]|uniref:siderophore-interacting protein n=1 Tax=Helcobacillus sp. ACRRO TaxID=2918202 RepID=UPI001EF452A0|nr:siderophore-interacting protein [Helcobacillus sp. ACRRO]MCG7426614.1 siderophore-interacting protein [Helcobacillus sp. ACRRO]